MFGRPARRRAVRRNSLCRLTSIVGPIPSGVRSAETLSAACRHGSTRLPCSRDDVGSAGTECRCGADGPRPGARRTDQAWTASRAVAGVAAGAPIRRGEPDTASEWIRMGRLAGPAPTGGSGNPPVTAAEATSSNKWRLPQECRRTSRSSGHGPTVGDVQRGSIPVVDASQLIVDQEVAGPAGLSCRRTTEEGVSMRVLIAGGSGAVGRPLVALLASAGHEVVATTRMAEKMPLLRRLGATPVVMDGLDPKAVGDVVARIEPEVIIHQMTGLAGAQNLRRFDRAFSVTNQLRTRGTEYLLAAARAVGVRRFVAQGYGGWPYAPGAGELSTEETPFDSEPLFGRARRTLDALRRQEELVASSPLSGVVLRYGTFYGPGASDELVALVRRRRLPIIGKGSGVWSWIHVEDAAHAAVAAMHANAEGVFNIADDEPARVTEWLPYLARVLGAPPPRRIPAACGRLIARAAVTALMTQVAGMSNAKAKTELGWRPRWSTWRLGFRDGLSSAVHEHAT